MLVSGQKSPISVLFFASAVIAGYFAWLIATPAYSDPGSPAAQPVDGSVTWYTSLSAAHTAAQKNGKNLLVDFSATWCGPCQAMIHDTFPSSEVAPLLKNFVCVRIDIDQDQNDAAKYSVNAIPRLLLLSPNSNTPRMDVTGYEDPDTFANSLRTALGMPQLPGQDTPATPLVSSAAAQVAEALSDNSFTSLKSKDGKLAQQGLADLVDQLSAPPGSEVIPVTPDMLSKSGKDGDTTLINALSSKLLAERVGAYSMYRHLHPSNILKFDPWAAPNARENQLLAWATYEKTGKPSI